jgi:hypothetical protein
VKRLAVHKTQAPHLFTAFCLWLLLLRLLLLLGCGGGGKGAPEPCSWLLGLQQAAQQSKGHDSCLSLHVNALLKYAQSDEFSININHWVRCSSGMVRKPPASSNHVPSLLPCATAMLLRLLRQPLLEHAHDLRRQQQAQQRQVRFCSEGWQAYHMLLQLVLASGALTARAGCMSLVAMRSS